MLYLEGAILGLILGYLSVPLAAYLIGEVYDKKKFHVGQIVMGIGLGQSLGSGIDKIYYIIVTVFAVRVGIYLYNRYMEK